MVVLNWKAPEASVTMLPLQDPSLSSVGVDGRGVVTLVRLAASRCQASIVALATAPQVSPKAAVTLPVITRGMTAKG